MVWSQSRRFTCSELVAEDGALHGGGHLPAPSGAAARPDRRRPTVAGPSRSSETRTAAATPSERVSSPLMSANRSSSRRARDDRSQLDQSEAEPQQPRDDARQRRSAGRCCAASRPAGTIERASPAMAAADERSGEDLQRGSARHCPVEQAAAAAAMASTACQNLSEWRGIRIRSIHMAAKRDGHERGQLQRIRGEAPERDRHHSSLSSSFCSSRRSRSVRPFSFSR